MKFNSSRAPSYKGQSIEQLKLELESLKNPKIEQSIQ
jgi:hypothetical protein